MEEKWNAVKQKIIKDAARTWINRVFSINKNHLKN